MKKKLSFALLLVIVGLLVVPSCEKKEDPIPIVSSQIIISPDELMLNDGETGKLFISVQPPQEFQWNIGAKPDWLKLTPSSGSVSSQIVEIEVVPDPVGLSEGKQTGTIEIVTNGAGKATSKVEFYVNAHPLASVTPTSLYFSETEDQKLIFIKNTGTGFLSWELQPQPSWLVFNHYSGTLLEGDSIQVVAIVSRNGLAVGTEQGEAVFVSNSEEGNVTMSITVEVPPVSILTLSASELIFDYFNDNNSLYIKNEGNIPMDWNISNPNEYLITEPVTGTLQIGDSIEISLEVDRTNLNSQIYNIEISIEYGEEQDTIVPIVVKHYKENKLLIEGYIIDAEYDRNNDVIIAVTNTPLQLQKFSPQSQTEETVALSLSPNCVSVSPDGNYAAVGHSGKVSYVNLNSMEVEEVYFVTTVAHDVVLASNGWVYVFPEQDDDWGRIRCIELATGIETNHTGSSIYGRTIAKLHPSGNFIYGANNGLSPSDFEKYDITGGTAAYMYDSPYHGNYSFGGDIWISEDGNRLFARSKNVFNSSENQSNDMTYNGNLVGDGSVVTLDHSTNANMIFAVLTAGSGWGVVPSSEVRMYGSDFLTFQGEIQLPGFLIPDGSGGGVFYNSLGYFGFFDSTGTQFYVIVKVEEGSGSLNEWAIATLEVE